MRTQLRPQSHFWPIAILYFLSAFIIFVALRIESLNAAAGSPLPKLVRALKENRDAGGSGKWRTRAMTPERWRRYYIDRHGEPSTRPLTPDEHAQMTSEVAHANADSQLKDFVSTYGFLLQHATVIVVLILATSAVITNRRKPILLLVYAIPLIIALLAGALAIYRGYFLSICIGI